MIVFFPCESVIFYLLDSASISANESASTSFI